MDRTTHPARILLPTIQDTVACPLLDGRQEAWIRCCTARFLPLARRVTGDDAAAYDALQESWIDVLHGIQRYRGDSPACAWVGKIVRNEALRQTRRRCGAPLGEHDGDDLSPGPVTPPAPGGTPEDEEHVRQMHRILLEIVTRLPPTYRQIVELRDLDELSSDEVAARLHISRSSVSSRLHRAHALLRRRLLRRLGLDELAPKSLPASPDGPARVVDSRRPATRIRRPEKKM